MLMSVSVRTGLIPVQLGLGHPAAALDTVLSAASEAEQVVDLLAADSSAIVQTGSSPFLKCGLAARDACAVTSRNPSARTRMVVSRRRIRLLLPRGTRVPPGAC